ncbi:MAG: PilW family protein [gamma proteobacterium symbiont of Bathyaustriella thionipta]|nr:PilW family protein [gamma proteobacterium symbiont of Bathyaustriella thionipta]MCU7949517.1 PilW family protein [gamma proteobacterium symbiont of Bathyaustriella thionipta]MCU7954152.1 PilW family protein [gamma proteobacterium symbiont of Bathyaustriella thionipta]MCU7956103.1 PilW family protein [gamma proteobacterium symbiont of Bathyaustriella thionipta]MCU7967565.1 PilW family protein [gamma proteobacterium symbiont of Bathyaustriella thionipta]
MKIFDFSQQKKTQTGLTLIEMMVAIAISLILMAGVSQIYLSNKKTYRTTNAISRIQEDGRFAINFLAREIRTAGNMGCINLDSMIIKNNLNSTGNVDLDALLNFDEGLNGTNNNADGGDAIVDGTDTIILKGVIDGGVSMDLPYMNVASDAIHILEPNDLEDFEIVLISDCKKGDLFEITSTNGTTITHNTGNVAEGPGNRTDIFSQSYGAEASIFSIATRVFSIQNGANGLPALFLQTGAGAAQELVEGVDNMQILYGVDGIDTDTVPDYYTSSDNVPDMSKVVSIRISLLLSTTTDNIVQQNQVYDYNGVQGIVAPDRRLRKVFNITVALRNRLK